MKTAHADATIYLWGDRRRGIHAAELFLRRWKRIKTAAQAPTSTSRHGLLALALVNSLKMIPGRWKRRPFPAKGRKMPVNIITEDETFAASLQALIENNKELLKEKPFRAGRNLLPLLARELARYDISLNSATEDDDRVFCHLASFARSSVPDPALQHPLLCSMAISEEV